jgi:hypothetical protein
MLEIECTCATCTKQFTNQFDETKSICHECSTILIKKFRKSIFFEKNSRYMRSTNFKFWHFLKWGTCYMAIFCPPAWYFSYKYGLEAELLFLIFIIVYPHIIYICDWLCEKF